jgi:hypothetical protein
MSCSRKRGGAATAFPLDYFDPSYSIGKNVSAGHDLLHASGRGVRPSIGPTGVIGGRRKSKRSHRSKRHRGGFVPSVMEGFVASASKYIVPLALFAGYKFMTRKGKKGRKATRRYSKRR